MLLSGKKPLLSLPVPPPLPPPSSPFSLPTFTAPVSKSSISPLPKFWNSKIISVRKRRACFFFTRNFQAYKFFAQALSTPVNLFRISAPGNKTSNIFRTSNNPGLDPYSRIQRNSSHFLPDRIVIGKSVHVVWIRIFCPGKKKTSVTL